jgi:DNA-binding NarL/FixJ family response regulator
MILVVENDPDFRRRYKKELEDEGLKVVTVANEDQAMEKVYNEPVDIVMLDVESQNEAVLEYLPKFKDAKPDIKVVATIDHRIRLGFSYDNRLSIVFFICCRLDECATTASAAPNLKSQ